MELNKSIANASTAGSRPWRTFDRVAKIYERAERLLFGHRLQDARTSGLATLLAPKRALLLGEGDGRFALALLQRFPECEVQLVDKSAKMLELAHERLHAYGARVACVHADALSCELQGPFDLVTTLFFLDCLNGTAQRRLIERVSQVLSPGAMWMYADFDPGPPGWRGLGHKLTLWGLYAGFGALTDIATLRYHDPLSLFAEHGLRPLTPPTRVGLLRSYTLTRAT